MLAYFVSSNSRGDPARPTEPRPSPTGPRPSGSGFCQRSFTRRDLLAGATALAGCARRKSRGFPGYAFVANAGARTVAAVDLNSFVLAKQFGLDSAPSDVLSNPQNPGVYVLLPESGVVCEIDATKLAVSHKTRL